MTDDDELAEALRNLAPLNPTQVTPPSILPASALWYVNTYGWRVFPCEPGGKKPLTQRGFHDASNDPEVVAAWWARWPEANIGVPTGEGFDVVDIDMPHGFATWNGYAGKHEPPTPLAVVRTGSGGQHRYHRPATNSGNRSFGTDVDYRGKGGYVIVPPSKLHGGSVYAWEQMPTPAYTEPFKLDELDAYMRELRGQPPPKVADNAQIFISDTVAYGRKALAEAVASVRNATEGFRNHTLNVAAFKLGRLIGADPPLLDEPTANEHLTRAAEDVGLGAEEIYKTIISGLKGGMGDPLVWRPAPDLFGPQSQAAGQQQATPSAQTLSDYEVAVLRRLAELRVDADARDRLKAERAAKTFRPPPPGYLGDDFVVMDDEADVWLIEDVLPFGANVTMCAPYKSGKTTLLGELLHASITGTPFLGNHAINVAGVGNVGWWDYEMSTRQHRRWLKALDLPRTGRWYVRHFRGHALNLLTDEGMAEAVAWLRERHIAVWIIDPFARAFLQDENDNALVTQWTDRLDQIKQAAGVHTLCMVVHTGRSEHERARGATRLDDWPDVRWLLGTEDGARFFSATGRDVDVPEVGLSFDVMTRRVLGNRPGRVGRSTLDEASERVLSVLPYADEPPASHADIARALGLPDTPETKSFIRAAMHNLVDVRHVATQTKLGRAFQCRRVEKGSTDGPTDQ